MDAEQAPGRLTIGIAAGAPMASCGAARHLALALAACPGVDSVRFVDAASDMDRFADSARSLDLLIEMDTCLDAARTDLVKSAGTRLVAYRASAEYVPAMQAMLFGRTSFGSRLFVNPRYDAIWMREDVAALDEGFVSTLWRGPVDIVPFLWEPDGLLASHEYAPRTGPRRLLVCEPNADVSHYCFYPVLIAEEAYRQAPDEVAFLHVTHAEHLATQSPAFVALMTQLDIVRGHKASFVRPFEFDEALRELGDVLIAHQWMQPAGADLLHACWQGWPVVHNAALCADLGYYYEGNDVDAGAVQALRAMREHDARWEAYRAEQRSRIERFRPRDPANVRAHARLLERVMAGALA